MALVPEVLPPFGEVNHWITLIDPNKRYLEQRATCPQALEGHLQEKAKRYEHCRWDNNLHMGPAYSAQFRGLESAIKVSPNMTFFYPIKLENYTRRIKSRFSEVLRTLPYPSQKVQLILMILTVVSLFPYLFWGMRNGSCCFSVYNMMNTNMVCSHPLSIFNFLLREISSMDYSVLIISGYFTHKVA